MSLPSSPVAARLRSPCYEDGERLLTHVEIREADIPFTPESPPSSPIKPTPDTTSPPRYITQYRTRISSMHDKEPWLGEKPQEIRVLINKPPLTFDGHIHRFDHPTIDTKCEKCTNAIKPEDRAFYSYFKERHGADENLALLRMLVEYPDCTAGVPCPSELKTSMGDMWETTAYMKTAFDNKKRKDTPCRNLRSSKLQKASNSD